MITFISRFANRAKDKSTQAVGTWFGNKYLKNLGHMTTLKIGSENHEVYVGLDLNGEANYRRVELNVVSWSRREKV